MDSSSLQDSSQPSPQARRKTQDRSQVTLDNTLTKIFSAAKHILNTLPKWANGQRNRDAVEGIFSALKIHCRLAFRMIEAAGLEVSSLKSTPDRIETLITAALNEQPPSPQALDKHMVYIKESIVKLLSGLRTKQTEYNALQQISLNETVSETPIESASSPSSPKPPPPVLLSEDDEAPRSTAPPPLTAPVDNGIKLAIPAPTTLPLFPRIDTSSIRDASPDRTVSKTSPIASSPRLSPEPVASASAAAATQPDIQPRSPARIVGTKDAPNPSSVPVNLKSLRWLSHNTGHSSNLDDEAKASETGANTKAISETSKDGQGDTVTIRNLFLQVNHQIKKVTYTGPKQPSFTALQILFMEKGMYNPGQEDFPEIYIRDPVYGVWHLLEDCAQIKDGTELRLQMEDPTEVIRRQLDTSLCVLTKEVRDLKRSVTENNDAIKRSGIAKSGSARGGDESSLASRAASVLTLSGSHRLSLPMPSSPLASSSHSPSLRSESGPFGGPGDIRVERNEAARMEMTVQTLRKDLSIARQQITEFITDARAGLGELGTKLSSFIETTAETRAHVQSASEKSRAMITDGKRRMATSTERLQAQMQDLQETIETLRLDVVARKSKPTASRMVFVEKELTEARKEAGEFLDFIEVNRPVWKYTWEEELRNIVQEQNYLKEVEVLAEDFVEDNAALEDLFTQLKQVITLQRNSASSSPSSSGSPTFIPPPPDPSHEGHTSVLQELASVPVDSSRRVRAMEKADKMRQKEREARKNLVIGETIDGDDVELEFEQELRGFVGQRKLRKTGGTQEVERLRQKRNDEALKKMALADDGSKEINSSNN